MKHLKYLEMKLLLIVLIVFTGSALKAQTLKYDENIGLFEMSYTDTVLVSEKGKASSSFTNMGFLAKGTENCSYTKLKNGSVKFTASTTKCLITTNVQVLVKYKDGNMADSKTNEDVSYESGQFIHYNMKKPIEKVRISSMNGFVYDLTGFNKTNDMLSTFKSLDGKQLNEKYSQPVDIYDGF